MTEINELIERIPALPDVKKIEPLIGGAVNETYRLFCDSGSLILRRDTPLAAVLGLDRQTEIDVLTVAADRGLGPTVIWADPDAGLLLTEYQEGHSWREADLHNKKNLGRIGKLLQRLHQVPIDAKPVDLSRYACRYAQQLATDEADRIAREAGKLADKWCAENSRHVLCHNDPIAGNIIETKENDRLVLIDWEYAGLGEPCFDLAVVIRHHVLSVADTRIFLDAYGVVDEVRLEGCMALYDRLSVLWLMVICAHSDVLQALRAELVAAITRLNH